MKQESLDAIKNLLIEKILNANIRQEDKIELAINVMQFLDNYSDSIKTLQEHQKGKFR